MRISDWSSDVCSSDLGHVAPMRPAHLRPGPTFVGWVERSETHHRHTWAQTGRWVSLRPTHPTEKKFRKVPRPCRFHWPCFVVQDEGHVRTEEHTSELQSLMRITFAVFY